MPPGIPITSLQDMLLLQQIQNNADPFRSGLNAIAEGVTQSIAQKQEEARLKKQQEDEFANQAAMMKKAQNTFGDKFEYGINNGKIQILPSKKLPNIPEGFEVDGYYESGQPKLKKKIPGISDLDVDKQIQARALSRKLYGVRGAESGLPMIAQAMAEGRTVDDIADMVRRSGESPEFTGAIRSAAQGLLIKQPLQTAQNAMAYIDDELESGNIENVQYQLKKLARDTAGVDTANQIIGKERTVGLLDEIKDDISELEAAGINTNIFSGNAEAVANNIGTVREPRLKELASKIQSSILNYRRSMTGVAFSAEENKEYFKMFPGIGKTGALNSSIINGLSDVFRGDVNNFYSQQIGPNNYKKIFSMDNSVDITTDETDKPASGQYQGIFY